MAVRRLYGSAGVRHEFQYTAWVYRPRPRIAVEAVTESFDEHVDAEFVRNR
jgi:hypothetical protein